MAESETLTVTIVREIRDEIRTTREDLGARLDQTNSRLDHVEGALLDLTEQQRLVVRYPRTLAERDAGTRLEIDELRERVDAIEAKLASG